MTERRFQLVLIASLIGMIVVTYLGEYFKSISLLFNILLAIIGIIAGYFVSLYFAQKSDNANLGKHAFSGYRLSVDVYNGILEAIEEIDKLKKSIIPKTKLSSREVELMFDIIAGRLIVVQRIALLANVQWKDALPKEQLEVIDLSKERKVQIKKETYDISQFTGG